MALRLRPRQGFFLSPYAFNIILGVLTNAIRQCNKTRQEIKFIQIELHEIKLFADDMIIYVENTQNLSKKIPE